MSRYRLITRQHGSEHVSSVVLTRDEALDQLDLEAAIHAATGWDVVLAIGDLEVRMVSPRGTERTIYARAASALEDATV